MQQPGLPHPGKYLRLHPVLRNRWDKIKNMAQMKEHIKAPEKIQLRDEEIANPCTIQNTGNQDTTELVDYGSKIQKEVKAMQSEIKENIQ